MSNFTGILTPATPPYTVGSGFDAMLYDAQGSQHILVRQGASLSLLGASGANRVTLDGNAAQWQVRHDGSTAIFTRGSDTVRIPALTEGQTIVFGDGAKELRIDTAGGAPVIKLGTQALTSGAAVVGGGGNSPDPDPGTPGNPGPGSSQKAPWTLVMRGNLFNNLLLSDGSEIGTDYPNISSSIQEILTNPERTKAVALGYSGIYGTDGTEGGTHRLGDWDGEYNALKLNIGDHFVLGNTVTDGTPAGTSALPFAVKNAVIRDDLNGAIWFSNNYQPYGYELTRIEIDDNGLVKAGMVSDIYPGVVGGLDWNLAGALLPDGRLVFSANDGVHGLEPWVSDGTQEGTRLLKDLVAYEKSGSYPREFIDFKGKVVFSGVVEALGNVLIITDGTGMGTNFINVRSDYNNFFSSIIGVAGDLLYFTASDADGQGIFRTDGNSFIKLAPSVGSAELLAWNFGQAFFRAADSAHGDELWVSDFQAGTFSMVKDILPGSGGGLVTNNILFPVQLLGDKLIFTAYTSATQQQLFISDGTEGGTVAVAANPPLVHAIVGDTLFFADSSGVKAVAATGSPAAISLTQGAIADNPNSGTSFQIQVDADQAFYALGGKLYASNGSVAGTVEIANDVQQFKVVAENAIYLIDNHRGLWYSDGTANGTRFVDTLSFQTSGNEMASAVGLKTIGMWDGDTLLP